MLTVIGIGLELTYIFFKAKVTFVNVICVRNADIAIVPRFVFEFCFVSLIFRVTKNVAVFPTVIINPGIRACAVVVPIF